MLSLALALLSLFGAPRARALDYGDKGIFPVYETGGQWAIFDKRRAASASLKVGAKVLVIGSEGERVFEIARSSAAYGGACRRHKPARVRTALLKGPRAEVGRPIIGIVTGAARRGGAARWTPLKNQVDEAAYAALSRPLKEAALDDVKSGKFKLEAPEPPEGGAEGLPGAPAAKAPEPLAKIDFGARLAVRGLKDPFVFVEETQIGPSSRRCVRLADGGALVGGCAEMPSALFAETDLLDFVAYDPSGKGAPYLLAFTRTTPKWGDERWGFVVRSTGLAPFLFDAMDPACRGGF